jgi:hypothetical protein
VAVNSVSCHVDPLSYVYSDVAVNSVSCHVDPLSYVYSDVAVNSVSCHVDPLSYVYSDVAVNSVFCHVDPLSYVYSDVVVSIVLFFATLLRTPLTLEPMERTCATDSIRCVSRAHHNRATLFFLFFSRDERSYANFRRLHQLKL